MTALAARTESTLARKGAMEAICKHVSCGGTLRDWCNTLNVKYADVIYWIQQDEERLAQYSKAIGLREEWVKESLVGNLAEIAQFDMGEIVDDDGSIKPISQWPEHARRAIQSMSVKESQNGVETSIKMPERLKAYELVGKAFGVWRDKVEMNAEVSFADMVMQAARMANDEE